MFRGPGAACALIFTEAVAVVGELIVKGVFTWTFGDGLGSLAFDKPLPKFATIPFAKALPVRTIVTVWPCCPLFGVTLTS